MAQSQFDERQKRALAQIRANNPEATAGLSDAELWRMVKSQQGGDQATAPPVEAPPPPPEAPQTADALAESFGPPKVRGEVDEPSVRTTPPGPPPPATPSRPVLPRDPFAPGFASRRSESTSTDLIDPFDDKDDLQQTRDMYGDETVEEIVKAANPDADPSAVMEFGKGLLSSLVSTAIHAEDIGRRMVGAEYRRMEDPDATIMGVPLEEAMSYGAGEGMVPDSAAGWGRGIGTLAQYVAPVGGTAKVGVKGATTLARLLGMGAKGTKQIKQITKATSSLGKRLGFGRVNPYDVEGLQRIGVVVKKAWPYTSMAGDMAARTAVISGGDKEEVISAGILGGAGGAAVKLLGAGGRMLFNKIPEKITSQFFKVVDEDLMQGLKPMLEAGGRLATKTGEVIQGGVLRGADKAIMKGWMDPNIKAVLEEGLKGNVPSMGFYIQRRIRDYLHPAIQKMLVEFDKKGALDLGKDVVSRSLGKTIQSQGKTHKAKLLQTLRQISDAYSGLKPVPKDLYKPLIQAGKRAAGKVKVDSAKFKEAYGSKDYLTGETKVINDLIARIEAGIKGNYIKPTMLHEAKRILDNSLNTSAFKLGNSPLKGIEGTVKELADHSRNLLRTLGKGELDTLLTETHVMHTMWSRIVSSYAKGLNQQSIGMLDMVAGGGGFMAGGLWQGMTAWLAFRMWRRPWFMSRTAWMLDRLGKGSVIKGGTAAAKRVVKKFDLPYEGVKGVPISRSFPQLPEAATRGRFHVPSASTTVPLTMKTLAAMDVQEDEPLTADQVQNQRMRRLEQEVDRDASGSMEGRYLTEADMNQELKEMRARRNAQQGGQ